MASVLVAEDEPAIAALLLEVLREAGHRAAWAGDGAAALARLRADPPDLLVLDLMLPVLDGWGVLRERRADPRLAAVPVLVASAANPADVERARALGADLALAKPFDLDALLAAVDALLGRP